MRFLGNFMYKYIDLLKLKAYKLFENSDLSWLLFFLKETNLLCLHSDTYVGIIAAISAMFNEYYCTTFTDSFFPIFFTSLSYH